MSMARVRPRITVKGLGGWPGKRCVGLPGMIDGGQGRQSWICQSALRADVSGLVPFRRAPIVTHLKWRLIASGSVCDWASSESSDTMVFAPSESWRARRWTLSSKRIDLSDSDVNKREPYSSPRLVEKQLGRSIRPPSFVCNTSQNCDSVVCFANSFCDVMVKPQVCVQPDTKVLRSRCIVLLEGDAAEGEAARHECACVCCMWGEHTTSGLGFGEFQLPFREPQDCLIKSALDLIDGTLARLSTAR